MKVAVVRGKYLSPAEMPLYKEVAKSYEVTAFCSRKPLASKFCFPVVSLASPMDFPQFPYKMPILNRLFVDGQWLIGLEDRISGYDIAHCAETYFRFTQQCLNAKKQGRVKKVFSTVFENIPFANEGIRGRKAYKQRAIREVDCFLAVSERARQSLLLEGCPAEKIVVFPPCVDTGLFCPSAKKSSPREINILFVGRIERCKGVYDLIYAARLILADHPDLKILFTVIGGGSELGNIVRLEKKFGIDRFFVHHKGFDYDKMPHEYNQADIFVAPSTILKTWQEQFSYVLMEAQSCGLPIVTTSSGSIVETVGDCALFAQPSDFFSLAEALYRMISSQKMRAKYGAMARKRALERFDAERGAKKLMRLYGEAIAEK